MNETNNLHPQPNTNAIDCSKIAVDYIVATRSASMPASCRGTYRRVTVLKVPRGCRAVTMMENRSRDVIEVVADFDRLNVGHTKKCAYQVALAEAAEIAKVLNKKQRRRESDQRRRVRRLAAV